MLTIKSLKVFLLSSLLSAWLFGIGSWSDFFGFMSYGLLPADKPAVSSKTVSETGDDNPKAPTDNQFRQNQTSLNSVNQKGDGTVDRSE